MVARYVPGGRTAVTHDLGSMRYPLRKFSAYAGLAAASWGLYCTLVGYIGGKAFEDNPLKGVILGIGLALTVTVIVEVVRHRLRKRKPQAQVEPLNSSTRAFLLSAGRPLDAEPELSGPLVWIGALLPGGAGQNYLTGTTDPIFPTLSVIVLVGGQSGV